MTPPRRTRADRLRTAVSVLREGRLDVLAATVSRAAFPPAVFRWNRLLFLELREAPVVAVDHAVGALRVRWADAGDGADADRLALVKPRRAEFLAHFAAGARCLLAELDDEPVAFAWIDLGPTFVSHANAYEFRLAPNEAWAFGAEVRPAWRGRGLYPRFWHDAFPLLETIGVDRVLIAVHADDERSRRAHAKCGFAPVCRMDVLRALGLSWHWTESDRGRRAGRGPCILPES